jgi:hypothetical protein
MVGGYFGDCSGPRVKQDTFELSASIILFYTVERAAAASGLLNPVNEMNRTRYERLILFCISLDHKHDSWSRLKAVVSRNYFLERHAKGTEEETSVV